jgi:hypothetical protein
MPVAIFSWTIGVASGMSKLFFRTWPTILIIHVEGPPSESNALLQGGSAKIELLYGILGVSQNTSTGMPFMLNFKCVLNEPNLAPFESPRYISGRAEVSSDLWKCFL